MATIFQGWESQETADATDEQIGAYVAALDAEVQACGAMSAAEKDDWAGVLASYNTITTHLRDVESASVLTWDPIGKLTEYGVIVDQLNALRPSLDAWNARVAQECGVSQLPTPPGVPSGGSGGGNGSPGVTNWGDVVKWGAIGLLGLVVVREVGLPRLFRKGKR